jgi:hypothetical protein
MLDPDHITARLGGGPAGDRVQSRRHRDPLARFLTARHQALGLQDVARAGVVARQGEGDPLLQWPWVLPDRPHPGVVADAGLDVVLHQPGRGDAQLGRDSLPGAGHDLHQVYERRTCNFFRKCGTSPPSAG